MTQPLDPSEFQDAFALLSREVVLQTDGTVEATVRSRRPEEIAGGAATNSSVVTIHSSQITPGNPPVRGNWVEWDGLRRVVARVRTSMVRDQIVWYRLEVGG